jgi:hypothetical protein
MNRIALIYILLTICSSLLAQNQKFTDQSRAKYILDITELVKWSKTASPFDFRVAILDKDSALFVAMQKEAIKHANMHDKPLSIRYYSSINKIGDVDVIFFKRSSRFSIDKVFSKIAGKQVLLITEGYQFHKSMINFIIINGYTRYEVNQAKIKAAGLKIDRTLLLSSVKTEADWSNLYEESLIDLVKYRNLAIKQRKELKLQKAQAEKQKGIIDSLIKQQIAFQQDYVKQEFALHEIEIKLEDLMKKMNQKQAQIRRLSKVISEKEQALSAKDSMLLAQGSTLKNMDSKLQQQSTDLHNQAHQEQQNMLLKNSELEQLNDSLYKAKLTRNIIIGALSLLIILLMIRIFRS